MATISESKKKDGSISYRAEIRIKLGGKLVYREAETWPKSKLVEQWADRFLRVNKGELTDLCVVTEFLIP